MKCHEIAEIRKISEIKRNNQHLLDKLMEISKGKNSVVNQKNIKIPRACSKSLNYASKKKEAERIDRENQKILTRIINVKAHKNVEIAKLKSDYRNGHLKNRRMLQNTGV